MVAFCHAQTFNATAGSTRVARQPGKSAAHIAAPNSTSATRAYVLTLPRTEQAGRLLVSHGDARLTPALSTSQIARGFVRVWPEMEQRHAQVWAFGHSHHARVWRNGAQVSQRDGVPIDDDARYCLNVGTTGLPFPGKGAPSVAVVDFVHGQIRQLTLERI